MPKLYNSLNEINPAGWSKRATAAKHLREAKAADAADPQRRMIADLRRCNKQLSDANNAHAAAVEHHERLAANLSALQAKASQMREAAYRKGVVSDNLPAVEAQISGLPVMIARAKTDIATALARVAEFRKTLADMQAAPVATTDETDDVLQAANPKPVRKAGRQ